MQSYWISNDLPHTGTVDELYQLYTKAARDIGMKREAIKETMGGSMKQAIFTVWGDEIQALQANFARMVRNNDFYLSDIVDMIGVMRDIFARQMEYAKST